MNLSEKLTGRTSYSQYYQRLKMVAGRPGTQVSILTILTIFTVIFFLIFAILPTFQTIAGLNREIKDAKTVEAKLQQKIHSLTQAEKLYQEIFPNLELLNQTLPAAPEFERLAWQLHWLANKHQLSIASGSFAEFPVVAGPDQPGETNKLELTLTLTGPYISIKNYLTEINRLDRLIEINEAIISNKSVRSEDQKLTAGLKLTAFYLPSL